MTRLHAVFDATVLLRAAVDEHADAQAWIERADMREIDAAAPQLIWAEITHVLLRYARSGVLTLDEARVRLRTLLELPIRAAVHEPLAPAALARAVATGLSGYDAFYLTLAEALDAVLVTADMRLAQAAAKAELVN